MNRTSQIRSFRLFSGCLLGVAWLGAAADTQNFCRLTASKVYDSCTQGAQSDNSLALAQCQSLASASARQTCRQQAAADLKDATQTCKDQLAARQMVCSKLGPTPYDPVIDPAKFVSGVTNPYFPLTPGTTFIYEGQMPDGFEHDEFAVTHNTRVIAGVTCIEVHDTVTLDGVLSEDTLDWFAQDQDGNVWYFGENTHELADGLITTIDGTFMAGVDGAKPGIVMKAHPAVGDFYLQEFALGNAEDEAETVGLSEAVTVPAGSYNICLKSKETSPLETDVLEYKYYAPGVGNVLTVDANTGARSELIEIRTNQP